MKKSLALVLALIMVLSSFSFVSAAPDFSDVAGTKYEDAVSRLELLNVLKGYPDGTFKPENTITRAEFAAVAVRVKGLAAVAEAAKGLPSGFSDVPAGHWAAGYVGVAGSTGIVNGIGGGLFAPSAPVKYEEAVTMIVRALGYEVSAQTKGGYPFGYLIVAQEIGLLDGVMGTMGVAAPRGMVAMLTDNALEIPMMIQVGFGTQTRWIVSGKEDTDEVYLLDFMGFTTVEGRVVEFESEDLEVEVLVTVEDDEEEIKVLDVMEGFDFFAAKGVTMKAWVDGDEVIAYTLKDTVKYDATSITDLAANKIKLVTEGKTYTVDLLLTDGSDVRGAYDFAKVVFDKAGKVVWIEGYDIDGFIVVDKVEKDVLVDLNDDELDLEDYTLVKDGKTIAASDVKKGDVVFFNYDDLAVVFNKTVEGEIDRVYSDMSFRVAGKVYKAIEDYTLFTDGDTLAEITIDDLEAMMDEGEEVIVFSDFSKNVVLVAGDIGAVAKSNFYAVVTAGTNMWTSRSGNMWSLDVFTEMGEKVTYDLTWKFIDEDLKLTEAAWKALAARANLVYLTVDADGEVTFVEDVTPLLVDADKFEVDDSYAKSSGTSYRLQASTVIFYDLDSNDVPKKVVTIGNIDGEFDVVEDGSMLVEEGRVKVVIASETDADEETTDVYGVLVKVRKRITSDLVDLTLEVAGTEKTYTTDDKVSDIGYLEELKGKLVMVTVGDDSGKLVEVATGEYAKEVDWSGILTVTDVSTLRRTIDVATNVYGDNTIELLSTAVVYDNEMDVINLRNIVKTDTIQVVFDGSSKRFVKFVMVNKPID